jgi:MFS family permease
VGKAEVESTDIMRKRIEPGQIGVVLRDRSLMAINISLLAISLLRNGLVLTIVPLFAYNELKLTPSLLGTVLTLSAVANFVPLLPAGTLSDRLGRKIFMITSLLLSAGVIVLLPFTADILFFTVLMVVLGFALGLTGSIGAWVTDLAKPAQLGTAMGVFRTVGDFGSLIGPILLTILLGPTRAVGALPFVVTALVLLGATAIVIQARDPARERAGKRDVRAP